MIAPVEIAASPLVAAPRGLTADALARVGLSTRAGAQADVDAPWRSADGRTTTLRLTSAGRPLVMVFTDYACTALCGPALAITAARLRETSLAAGRDYRLAVIGLDPATGATESRSFVRAHLGAGSELERDTAVLTGTARSIGAETAALGFGYAYDPSARRFVHPVAAFVLTPGGRTTAALSEVTLSAQALQTAIAAAAADRVTPMIDRLAIACHGALAAVGRFDAASIVGLRLAGLATLAAMGGAIVWRLQRERRSR